MAVRYYAGRACALVVQAWKYYAMAWACVAVIWIPLLGMMKQDFFLNHDMRYSRDLLLVAATPIWIWPFVLVYVVFHPLAACVNSFNVTYEFCEILSFQLLRSHGPHLW